jgi:CheY-like chemotaxis protein
MARILLVDDMPDAVRIVAMMLRGEHHEIVGVGSPDQALTALAREPFDLVIADQNMPGMTGDVLLARVGVLWPFTARLLLTADPRLRDGELPFPVMHKPFKLVELRALVSRLLATVEREPSGRPRTEHGRAAR